ncbi:FAD/NAD(P)-binding domain-containing protein [Protomyces lactucae-debilis]|uniref:Kynurenine 3-monooxygenase n=1 Tax=Protomyces lactucae-debilis TaxID=2754530 RepID=A0A1Y2F811_PROLT|nr:FAD/NAD(P)-binding domain-containing protein [Protomyces lactucae-debilis]ORY80031.1 FAD/NAD(P)-binding domain-containing protein [Protomyces lactucae-debilis]
MSDFQVVVVGAGLVGALAAISFAKQGYSVSVYDVRKDPRKTENAQGRSINLAVSARGLGAIKSIDASYHDKLVARSIPMKGRMIHVDGKEDSQLYGLFGECIHSIDRSQLNIDLLDEADGYDKVSLHFEHKFASADFDNHKAVFTSKASNTDVPVHADLLVGCDGAYSAVRSAMMRVQKMNLRQEYIEHEYLELSMPAKNDDYQLSPHHLHIWPRQEFMLIALPNPDKSFTSTLFAPTHLFKKTPDEAVAFFRDVFPDALPKIGEDRLREVWQKNPVAPLIQVTCAPYHYKDRCILLGDATHAMVPFYGQGMNCGFEDLRVLNTLLEQHKVTPQATWELGAALEAYSAGRKDDLSAILKLAMGNYIEMRSSVTSRLYLARRHLDGLFGRLFKDSWVPMYSMVSFRDDIRYSDVIRRQARQSKILEALLVSAGGVLGLSLATSLLYRAGRVIEGVTD